MKHLFQYVAVIILVLGTGVYSFAGEPIATLRGAALDINPAAPIMTKKLNSDIREIRNYAEQPPIIPHNIRDYHIDLNSNKCLSCHNRTTIAQSQAPMVSVTHFMDRDGQILAAVTPRRYFCTQCHVPQHLSEPLVENQFIDADTLIKE